jgi:hypothetical protein
MEELKRALERFRSGSLGRVSVLPSPDALSAAFGGPCAPSDTAEVTEHDAKSVFPPRLIGCWTQMLDTHNAAVADARFADVVPRMDGAVFETAWPDRLCLALNSTGD